MQIYLPKTIRKWFPQPLDRRAISLILGLSVSIGLLLWSGDHTAPRVRDFSWQDKQVGAEDIAFTLTFNRPMNQASVEANLRLEPPLAGKFSWAGRQMAYTLTEAAPYGRTFQVRLAAAQGRLLGRSQAAVQPFLGRFMTRDRAFVCLGGAGADAGRLILYNLTRQQKKVLTPPELVVGEFEPYPQGDQILFSATERGTQKGPDPKLYTVSTGIRPNSPQGQLYPAPAAEIQEILDNKDFQILKFDLSPDGQTVVVQRSERQNLAHSALWILQGSSVQLLDNQPGGDFLITPDSNALVIAQGQGLAVLPLDPQRASQPLDFLPNFGTVLNFSRDGGAAAMVKFNTDYTRSLFLVTPEKQQELLRTTGSILSAQFDPLKQTLYCLLTQLLPGSDYRERPYVAAIDLQTRKLNPLVVLPMQRDVQISLAPDGAALLFDQTALTSQLDPGTLKTPGATGSTGSLWLLPVPPTQPAGTTAPLQPEALPLSGFHPRWLP